MAGTTVAGAGDVNGDGPGDVLVGAPFAGNRGRSFSGSVYARFSRPGTRAVTLVMPGIVRRVVGRHSRLRTRVLLSQCTTVGYEYTARSRIVLRRR